MKQANTPHELVVGWCGEARQLRRQFVESSAEKRDNERHAQHLEDCASQLEEVLRMQSPVAP